MPPLRLQPERTAAVMRGTTNMSMHHDPTNLDGAGLPAIPEDIRAMSDGQLRRTIAGARDRWLLALRRGDDERAADEAAMLEVAVAERHLRDRLRRGRGPARGGGR